MSGFYGTGPNGVLSNDQCSKELENKCGNINSDISCYYKPDNVNMISTKGNQTCLAGNTQQYNCAYYSTIQMLSQVIILYGLQEQMLILNPCTVWSKSNW